MALFTILALLIGLYAAFHFSDKFSHFISAQTDSMPEYLPAFSFLILFLLVGACIYFGGKALEQVIKIAQLSLVNKLLGAALGLIFTCWCLYLFWGKGPRTGHKNRSIVFSK